MLLPDKHISVAESLLGLGAFLLERLEVQLSIDDLHELVESSIETEGLPAYHDFDAVTLALLFLYSIDAVELTESGMLKRCD